MPNRFSKPLLTLLSFFLFLPTVWAVEPRYKAIPSIGWSLDRVVDTTSAGTVSGRTVAATDLDCTAAEFTNGGAVTTTADGEFICSDDDGGSSGNSFETIATPAGTNPVADSSTDTLTLTETAGIDIVGTAGTDTIDVALDLTELTSATFGSGAFTSITLNGAGDDFSLHQEGGISYWKNGTDSAIIWLSDTSNAFTIPSLVNCDTIDTNANGKLICGTDTGGAGSGDVTDVNEGTYIDVTNPTGPAPSVAVDTTEMEAVTFGAGGNATNAWTFNLSGTDPVITFGSGSVTVTGDVAASGVAGPDYSLTPTGGEIAHWGAEVVGGRTLSFLGDASSGLHHLLMDFGTNTTYLPRVSGCIYGLVTDASGKLGCRAQGETKCGTFENLVAADDNMLFHVFPANSTVRSLTCRHSGFTTIPDITFEDDSGNAVAPSITCSSAVTTPWQNTTSGNTFAANEAVRFDVTSTPAPISGTQATICMTYTQD